MVESSPQYEAHAKALQSRMIGLCTVTEKVNQKDPITKETKQIDKVVFDKLKCRLSFSTKKAAVDEGMTASAVQSATLFVPAGILIKPGSIVRIVQAGQSFIASKTGKPAFYLSHTAYPVESFEVTL